MPKKLFLLKWILFKNVPLKDLKIVIGLIKNIEPVSSAGNGVLFLKCGEHSSLSTWQFYS